jgi:hypothetical protein
MRIKASLFNVVEGERWLRTDERFCSSVSPKILAGLVNSTQSQPQQPHPHFGR